MAVLKRIVNNNVMGWHIPYASPQWAFLTQNKVDYRESSLFYDKGILLGKSYNGSI